MRSTLTFLVVLLVGLFASNKVACQVSIAVVDPKGVAVPYAHLAWQPIGPASGGLLVMDAAGKGTLSITQEQVERGVVVQLSFVGYATLLDTLWSAAPVVLTMIKSPYDLPEVVVTGQYGPLLPERAVQRVRVLDETQFERMAANNLGDALRNELNVRLAQDNILGTSMSMQGLGGQNVKILIDGIPVIGRQGGNVDLAQIDLTGIQRVEIIEGPMSVNYGTDALAGTINLITRKGGGTPASLKAVAYAEHIGRLNTTLTGTRHWGRNDIVLTAGRNFFGGWDPNRTGPPSYSAEPADSSRHQQWKPREQYFGRLNYRWVGERWTLGYKTELMHDVITDRGAPRAPYYETAFDQRFRTIRFDNAVFADAQWAKGRRFKGSFAYDRYDRTRNTWFRDLTTMGEQLVSTDGMQDTTGFTLMNLRAAYSSAPDSGMFAYEFGTDLNRETGEGQRLGGSQQIIEDYAFYASLEWKPITSLTIRPGARYAINSRYTAPVIPSVNIKWDIAQRYTVRASYAQGFRAPSLKELYFDFVDVNHDITGNVELTPERSHNANLGLAYRHAKDKAVYTSELNGFYNVVDDLISLAQVSGSSFTYRNIGTVRTMGGSAGAGWDNGHWSVSVGASVTGRYDELSERGGEPILYSPEARASLTKQWMRKGWSASLFWKYQGRLNTYVVVNETEVQRSFIDPFHMADASVTKKVLKDRLVIVGGCKDIFNVRNVNASAATGVHASGDASVPMTTGRTAFLKLELLLTKKKG